MGWTNFSDLLSAIHDLSLAIASPRVELEDLIGHMQICDEEAYYVEILDKDKVTAHRLAEVRSVMRELNLSIEHERRRYLEKTEQSRADGEKQVKEPRTMEEMRQRVQKMSANIISSKLRLYTLAEEMMLNMKELVITEETEGHSSDQQNWKALVDTKEPSLTSQTLGRDGDKDKIIQWLLSDTTSKSSPFGYARNSSNFSAMLIIGEGGIGKTTLAKLVYDDATVRENFSTRAWLRAADGHDAVTIFKAIFSSIACKSSSDRGPIHLQTIIQQHVNGKRLLLVLDGFEDVHPSLWEHLRAPFSGVKRGKFLITCRRRSDRMKDLESYDLRSLPEYLSSELLVKCAIDEGSGSRRSRNFQDAEMIEIGKLTLDEGSGSRRSHNFQDAEMIEIGKQIACKCKGLPLALRVLGGLLGYHPIEETWRRVLESHQWKSAKGEISSAALQLSFKLMPLYLRECVLYCSVFPKGYKLDKYELVRLWMAQGHIMPRDNKREEDIGLDYFKELHRMSFFDKSPDGDGTFIMHDLVYDLFKSKFIGECCSIKGGDACDIPGDVRHLHVIGGDKSWHNLTTHVRKRLYSFFYKSLDGMVPEFLSSLTGKYFLRALELKLYDDSTAAPEITLQSFSEKSDITSIRFADFINLRYLRICDKSMEGLPASMCQLRFLQTLHLDKCSNLRELPSDIGNLINLRYIGLSDASIQMLPDSVCRLFNLQSLILDHCKNLSTLPDNIGDLHNLHYIGLSRTNIQRLPETFHNLSKLPILNVDHCKLLVELPSSIGKLNLESLQVRETKINTLPESVCHMSILLKLDMAGSDLLKLPDSIGNLRSLIYLGLSHTNISVLPKSLCRLSSLLTLKLDNCKNLACLPSGIGDLAKLHELLLSSTNIGELPESICKLSNLQRLELDGCTRFLSLPHSIGQLTSLCHVNLSDTEIAELPASICQLTNLQTLELNGCHRLSEMPANIGNLINLRDLQLTDTKVSELPRSFCQLSKLKTLNLNGNRKLQDLPSGIENLSNLRHLELSQVAIEVLPKQICQLSRLQKLNFEYMQKLPSDSY